MSRKNSAWNRNVKKTTQRKEEDERTQVRRIVLKRLGAKRFVPYIIILLLTINMYMIMNPTQQATSVQDADLNPTGKQTAYSTVANWLADNSPLGDDGRIISWDGADKLDLASGNNPVTAWRHELTAQTSLGWWKVNITVENDGKTIGQPSAMRVEVGNSSDDTVGWANTLGSADATEAVNRLADSWAAALVGTDADKLTVIMQDPDPTAQYPVLALGEASDVNVDMIDYLNEGKVNKDTGKSTRAVARVTITLKARDNMKGETRISYDMKIADPDGTPRILAWGAPGTGTSLKDWSNRWTGDGEMPDWTQTTTTSATTSTEGANR